MPVLNLRQTDADGRVNRVALDTDADDFAGRFEDHLDAVREEAARPVEARLSAAETDRDAHRETLVAEILRVEALSAGSDYDLASEREFYESLTPAKLALHFAKATKAGVTAKPQTSGEEPAAEGADAGYGHVTVA